MKLFGFTAEYIQNVYFQIKAKDKKNAIRRIREYLRQNKRLDDYCQEINWSREECLGFDENSFEKIKEK